VRKYKEMNINKFYISYWFESQHKTFNTEAKDPQKALKKIWPKARLWSRTVKLNKPWKKEWQAGPKLTRIFMDDGTVLYETTDGVGSRYTG